MQDKAIIKVKVTENGGKVTYGTAYRINRSYAITALHVIEDFESIEFIFANGHETGDFTLDYENSDFDIALVTFADEFLDSLDKIEKTEIGKAKVHDKWYGAGYPKFAENGECRNKEPLKGSCYHCPENDEFFDIECDKVPICKEWGGVSGAPLFIENKLSGVIVQFDKATENTNFAASAIWKLLAIDDFSNKVLDRNKPEKILQSAQQFLRKNPGLKNALDHEAMEKNIVLNLVAQNLPELLENLDNLHVDKEQRRTFVLKLLPWYFRNQAVVIDEAVLRLKEEAIDIDCAGEVAAECCVAAFSEREAYLDCIPGSTPEDDQLVVSKGKYAMSPETGIGQETADMEALTQHILSSSALDEILSKRFAPTKLRPERLVNRKLEQAKKGGNHYYLVVRIDKDVSDCMEKLAAVRRYKEKYPELIILNLSSSVEIEELEDDLDVFLPLLIREKQLQ